uniref:Uncharacterized protein n=1 Tax=Knipowitschia caucasica TaxID=637954 RepID=A0AAV2L937_KNICA
MPGLKGRCGVHLKGKEEVSLGKLRVPSERRGPEQSQGQWLLRASFRPLPASAEHRDGSSKRPRPVRSSHTTHQRARAGVCLRDELPVRETEAGGKREEEGSTGTSLLLEL